ncbi:hypothetical protein AAEY33_03890 [Peribacillus simplex]|uniref:hypothetical protein n=1 Tax=Peribacillus simplex TaxID=1478 RepID=UPI0032639712
MKLLSILGGNAFVMFNKELAHEVSVNGAIIFGQLCSSYESFGSKNMLSTYKGENYFYLTSETIQEETALSYKQQVKAIKDLEEAGYIKTVIMGSPARKYFHITNKIMEQFKDVSSDKREKLNKENIQETIDLGAAEDKFRIDKREEQACTKGQTKPLPFSQAYKDINKKEQDKEINYNFNCNYKVPLRPEPFRALLTNSCNEFYTKFSVGRYSKKQWNTLIEKFVNDTIESERYINVSEHKIKGFAYKCLERIIDHNDYKHSEEFSDYQEVMRELNSNHNMSIPNPLFYNWLE